MRKRINLDVTEPRLGDVAVEGTNHGVTRTSLLSAATIIHLSSLRKASQIKVQIFNETSVCRLIT
jgi:hypothetical protein